MRKLSIILICCFTLFGCAQKSEPADDINEKYKNYIEMIIQNKDSNTENIPFDYELIVQENGKGEYIYEVAINNPKIAMYDVEMIVADVSKIGKESIFPSIGIADEEKFSMIPFQSNPERGFYPGFACNGVADSANFNLSVMVVYHDYAGLTEKNVFFNVKNEVLPENSEDVAEEEIEAEENESHEE